MNLDNFKGVLVNTSRAQLVNIESNWKFIYGGLSLHRENQFVNKYGIIHLIRQIDGYYKYKPTKALKNILDKNNINYKEYLSSKDRTSLNRKLKEKGVKDTIQIEHLNGGLKSLVNLLINEYFNGKKLEELKEVHINNSLCCYKLRKLDNNINENTEINSIEI